MNNSKSLWVLFLISPFFSFLLALKNGFNKNYQPIILAFSFVYGFAVFPFSGDILGYQETYFKVIELEWSDFFYILFNKLDPNLKYKYLGISVVPKPDIFAFIVSFLTSRVFDTPRVMWGLISLTYTWFMLLFFNSIVEKTKIFESKRWHYVFILFLIFIIPKSAGVAGVRFWPALFLFMYSLVKYVDTKKIKFLIVLSLSVLFHYTFFIPITLLLISILLPFKRYIIRGLVLFSIVVFSVSSVSNAFGFLSKLAESVEDTSVGTSVSGYTNQDIYETKQSKRERTNWYIKVRSNAPWYLFGLFYIVEFFGLIKLRDYKFTNDLFYYITIFFCLTLITINLGSIGRFKNIFYLLFLARMVIIFPINLHNNLIKNYAKIVLPFLVIFMLVSLRTELYYVENLLPIQNIVSVLFTRGNKSLSEFLAGY